jgi:hypothetical protein
MDRILRVGVAGLGDAGRKNTTFTSGIRCPRRDNKTVGESGSGSKKF